jgi:hypothetical protein
VQQLICLMCRMTQKLAVNDYASSEIAMKNCALMSVGLWSSQLANLEKACCLKRYKPFKIEFSSLIEIFKSLKPQFF